MPSQDVEADPRTGCAIIFDRLMISKFNEKSLRSLSALRSEEDYIEIHDVTALRGRWNTRFEFLLSCIGFAVGLGNVWRFPIKVYENGGGAFLISYTIICIILGVPLLMLELGLGQFTGRGPTKAFKVVPIMYGIGWSMVMISLIIEIYYAPIIAISYFYLFGSLNKVMPWTVCNHEFNSKKCLGSFQENMDLNISDYVSSSSEYWDYYVTGFVKYPERTIYTLNEFPGPPQWHLTLCLLFTWVTGGFALMNGIKVSGKIMYFSVLYPYFALISIFCVASSLPGAMNGIKFYLTPNWKKLYDPTVLRVAIEQLFFSCSIAMGGMITYASYNDFRDNFYRDAIIIIIIDYFTSVLAGLAIFPVLGYLSQRTGAKIEKVISSGSSLFFITLTEALATIPGSQLWTILLMVMAISLGLDSQIAMFETVSTGIMDAIPILQTKKEYKFMMVWALCSLFFLCGLLLITPGGKYWFNILDKRISSFGLPILAILETICLGLIYGFKQLRYDYRMMTGFSLSWYWFIVIAFVGPLAIFVIFLTSLINVDYIYVNGIPIPMWGEVIALTFLFIVLFPIFYGIIYTIVTYFKKYPEIKGKAFLKKLIEPPIYWGPHYKKYWISSSKYRKKLLQYKDDPLFLKYVSEVEDINIIVSIVEKENSP